jgi:hypothetical protein
MCRCSISNNIERLPIFFSLLSTMYCCWWTFGTFVTLNVKISQFCLYSCMNYEHSKCVCVFWDTLYIVYIKPGFSTSW